MMTKPALKISRFALLGWGGIYLAAFLWVYAYHVVPRFAFQGFVYLPDARRTAVIAVLVLTPLLWMPLKVTRPSTFALWVLYFMVYTPAMVVGFHVLRLGFPFPWFFGLLFCSMLFLALLPFLPLVRLPKLRLPHRWLVWGLVGAWLGSYLVFFKAFGFHGLPSLSEIYRVRLAARQTVSSQGGIFGYLLRWFASVINPFLMALGIRRRQWLLLGIAVLGQVLIFTFDATKSTLVSVVYLLGLYLFFEWKRWQLPAVYLFEGGIALLLGGVLLDTVFHTSLLEMYVLRRVFYVPGLLTGFYYDYFSSHAQWHWAHTIVGRLLGLLPPAGTSAAGPGFLIGAVYFNKPAGNANVNLWADAFANFGNAGVVFVTLTLFFMLWLYDSLSYRQDPALAFMLMAMPVFSLTNTSLLTALSTHGWALALLLLWLWPWPPSQGVSLQSAGKKAPPD